MTEYDYSPEAYERYLAQQEKIARWVQRTEAHAHEFANPFQEAPQRRRRNSMHRELDEHEAPSMRQRRKSFSLPQHRDALLGPEHSASQVAAAVAAPPFPPVFAPFPGMQMQMHVHNPMAMHQAQYQPPTTHPKSKLKRRRGPPPALHLAPYGVDMYGTPPPSPLHSPGMYQSMSPTPSPSLYPYGIYGPPSAPVSHGMMQMPGGMGAGAGYVGMAQPQQMMVAGKRHAHGHGYGYGGVIYG